MQLQSIFTIAGYTKLCHPERDSCLPEARSAEALSAVEGAAESRGKALIVLGGAKLALSDRRESNGPLGLQGASSLVIPSAVRPKSARVEQAFRPA